MSGCIFASMIDSLFVMCTRASSLFSFKCLHVPFRLIHLPMRNTLSVQVVRSYMHVSGSGPLQGLLDGCRTIFREDGIKGFYRGERGLAAQSRSDSWTWMESRPM